MKSDKSGFYVTGGNDDFKTWHRAFYFFNCRKLTKPEVLPELPYPV